MWNYLRDQSDVWRQALRYMLNPNRPQVQINKAQFPLPRHVARRAIICHRGYQANIHPKSPDTTNMPHHNQP